MKAGQFSLPGRMGMLLASIVVASLFVFGALSVQNHKELLLLKTLQQSRLQINRLNDLDKSINDLFLSIDELRHRQDSEIARLGYLHAEAVIRRFENLDLEWMSAEHREQYRSLQSQYAGIQLALQKATRAGDTALYRALIAAAVSAVYAITYDFREIHEAGQNEVRRVERQVQLQQRSHAQVRILIVVLWLVFVLGAFEVYRRLAIVPLQKLAGTGISRLKGKDLDAWEKQSVPELRALAHSIGRLQRSRQKLRERHAREVGELSHQVKESSRLRNDFLAGISHEIRTPLNNLVGNLELLEATEQESESRNLITTIQAAVDNLLEVINDLLAFSRLENEDFELNVIEFDLCPVVESICSTHFRTAHEKNVELICIIEKGVPFRVCGDGGRLRQVLYNLVGNAVKFTESGEVVVRVNQLHQGENKSTVCFEISDTGIGIQEEQMATLFDPFMQADSSMSRTHDGLGLGLTISHRLVEKMGGRISARSKPGSGSVFTFKIQLDVTQAEPPQSCNDQRVLVIESHAKICESLHEGVELLHGNSTDVSDLETAVKLLQDPQWSDWIPTVVLISWNEVSNCDPASLLALRGACGPETRIAVYAPLSITDNSHELAMADIDALLSRPIRSAALSAMMDHSSKSRTEGLSWTGQESRTKEQLQIKEPKAEKQPSGSSEKTSASRSTASRKSIEMGWSSYCVLAVDDNPVNLKLIENLLGKRDYQILLACDGLEALAIMESRHIDLVLMDCMMPRLDGLSATQRFRQSEQDSWTRIIALTANAVSGDRERCIAAGMDDYLEKPVRRKTLYTMLDRYLPPLEISEVVQKKVENAGAGQGGTAAAADQRPGSLSQEEKDLAALHLDIRVIKDDSDGDQEFEQELIQLFLKDAARRLDSLESAIDASRTDEVHLEAHTVKGICAGIGAHIMQEIAFELEQKGSIGELRGAESLLSALREEYTEVRQELECYLEDMS